MYTEWQKLHLIEKQCRKNVEITNYGAEPEIRFDASLVSEKKQHTRDTHITIRFISDEVRYGDAGKIPAMLADGIIDVMPGMWYRPYWFPSVHLSAPYITGTMALAVRDERRHEFTNIDVLQHSNGLKIGIPLDYRQVEYSMRRYFGDADVEFVTVEFWQPYFEGAYPELDAFLVPAENGSAWTLLHPEYTVVVPQPDPVKVPSAFGLAMNSRELTDAVNEWVIFATNEGMIDRAHDYWILGQGAEEKRQRWSIVRDVLGWID